MKINRFVQTCLTLTLTLLGTLSSRADVILFDTMSDPAKFPVADHILIAPGGFAAQQFIPDATATQLTRVTLSIDLASSTATSVAVKLWDNGSNIGANSSDPSQNGATIPWPGTAIFTLSSGTVPTDSNWVINVPLSCPVLVPNNPYWISLENTSADPTTQISWHYTSDTNPPDGVGTQPVVGVGAYGTTIESYSSLPQMMTVEATTATAVPEPSATWMTALAFGLGGLKLGFARARRSRK